MQMGVVMAYNSLYTTRSVIGKNIPSVYKLSLRVDYQKN
jgi:hypothetical protein